jgi:anti-anti-sigma factor
MSAPDTSIRASRLGLDQLLISVAGELDLHSVDPLREALEAAIVADDGDVVVDLGDVRFLDSIALGILANAATRLRQQGRLLSVVAAREESLTPFVLSGLDRLIALRRTLEETFAGR